MPAQKPKNSSRWLFLIAFLLVMGSGVGVVIYSLSGQTAWAKAKKLQNPIPPTPQTIESGMQIYREHCQNCHGANGDGKGQRADELSVAPADFSDAHKMKQATDGELYWEITKGQNPMPAFEDKLTEEQRWQSVDFVRSFAQQSVPPPAPNTASSKIPGK